MNLRRATSGGSRREFCFLSFAPGAPSADQSGSVANRSAMRVNLTYRDIGGGYEAAGPTQDAACVDLRRAASDYLAVSRWARPAAKSWSNFSAVIAAFVWVRRVASSAAMRVFSSAASNCPASASAAARVSMSTG